jgi:hypothetical protein
MEPISTRIAMGWSRMALPSLDASAVMEVFRRMLLLRLHQAERLSKSFRQNLLSWVHSGFSVYAGSPVDAEKVAAIESQAPLHHSSGYGDGRSPSARRR